MSKQATHTPGPWTTNLKVTSEAGRVAIEPDVAIVYVQPSRYDSTQSQVRLANARLIAAAPDLLEALEPFANIAKHTDLVESLLRCVRADERATFAKALADASAAIAKAKGES